MGKANIEISEKDQFMLDLKTQVDRYLADNGMNRFANGEMFAKMSLYIIAQVSFYVLMLNSTTQISFLFLYLATSLITILSAINMAHDAAHDVIFKSKRWNYILYYISFQLTGYNPDTWKSNHVKGHHSHPNTQVKDPHFPETPFFRFAPWQVLKPHHKFQHIYAVLLYSIHSVIYFFIEEPRIFLGLHHHIKLSTTQIIKGIIGKCIYIFIFIILPIIYTDVSYGLLAIAFIGKHIIISIIMTLVLGINHFTETTTIIPKDDNTQYSWAQLQLGSTIDFATENRLVYWLFGGFNAHAFHHLFPGICHVYYRQLTPILKKTIAKHNIPYQEVSFFSLLKMHFKYLKKMGSNDGKN